MAPTSSHWTTRSRARHVAGAFARAAFVAAMFLAATRGGQAQGAEELVILNWADYFDPAVVAEFERRHDARVRQVYFDQDQTRDRMLLDADAKGYDLAVVDDTMVSAYRDHGWLAPLNEENAPNLRNIAPRWRDLYPRAAGYAAPFAWGTLGIAYRADLLPDGLTSWQQFFEPSAALKNKIAMTGNGADTIGMALKALGFSVNSTDPKELAAVEAMLLKQRPYVRQYDYMELTRKAPLVSGDVVASMMYNGDALTLAELDPNIAYVLPREGSAIWVDYIVVLEGSGKKDLARAFVDFLNEPEIAARVAEYAYCATPNTAAEAFLPADVLADPIIYPPADILAKSEVYLPLPPRAEKQRSSIYARVAY